MCQEAGGYFLIADLVCVSHIVVFRVECDLFDRGASVAEDLLGENPNLSQICASVFLELIGLDKAETTPLNSWKARGSCHRIDYANSGQELKIGDAPGEEPDCIE